MTPDRSCRAGRGPREECTREASRITQLGGGSQWHFKAQDHVLTTAEKVAPVPVLARPLPRCPLRVSVERQSKEKLGEASPGGTGSVHSPREQAGGCRGWAWAVDPGPWGEAGA